MNFSTNCKFCQNPITVAVDDDYAKMGDPYKLLPKACCNECSDVRVVRRLLEERIGRVATVYAAMHRPSETTQANTRKNLAKLCEAYARVIARMKRVEGMAWDEASVDTIMENPSKWAEVLSTLWKMFRQWQAQQVRQAEADML
jgi:hypothetical protein